jgi:hypothetical protein
VLNKKLLDKYKTAKGKYERQNSRKNSKTNFRLYCFEDFFFGTEMKCRLFILKGALQDQRTCTQKFEVRFREPFAFSAQ